MRDLPFVTVFWMDAWKDEENFATAHAIAQNHRPMDVETRGWLIVDDEVGVSVAAERSMQDGHTVYRDRSFIPRVNVKSVAAHRIAPPRKKPKAQRTSPDPAASPAPTRELEPSRSPAKPSTEPT